MMVAVDDRKVSQDWMCVSVRSVTQGQRLGEATRLVVRIHDAAKRPSVARRVARNLDVLLRGVGGAVDVAVDRLLVHRRMNVSHFSCLSTKNFDYHRAS